MPEPQKEAAGRFAVTEAPRPLDRFDACFDPGCGAAAESDGEPALSLACPGVLGPD